jgi:E3 ubiquitin-protein transferase RMND5
MSAFCWINNKQNSPYTDYFTTDTPLWTSVAASFREQFCALLGFSPLSPLSVAVTAGTIALPVLLKMSSIMREKHTEWSSEGELPVEIPLPANYHFHSIFTCPVSKEQSTEQNPPMLLTCGHCFCKMSLARLTKSENQKIKCPYVRWAEGGNV